MTRGRLRDRLSRGRALVGLLQMRLNPLLVKMASECGYNFLILDGEHGVFSEDDFAQSLQAIAATNVLAMVRLAGHDTQALSRYLGMGADAVVVPHVSTAAEASALARAMGSEKQGSLIVIIESVPGVSHSEEILAVDGVDGVLVGPNDLSADFGSQGDYTQPSYVESLSRIERAAAMTGKVLGTAPHGDYSVQALQARGHRLLVLGTDQSLLQEAMTAQMVRTRSSLSSNLLIHES